MSIIIQKRDRDILKYVFALRVATYSQIRRRFFAENKNSAAKRRIRALCRARFLRQSRVDLYGRAVVGVSLTERTWPEIVSHWPFEIDKPHFKSESQAHDLRLAEIQLRLEQLTIFRGFMTENLLQSSTALAEHHLYRDLVVLQADGALQLQDPTGHTYLYGVEFEVSKKAPERYESKLSSYYRAGGIDGVIYICGTQEIADLIARTDRKIRPGRDSIVFWELESNVLASQGSMFFRNVESRGIKLF